MEPITVHGAATGRPFTVPLDLPTVRGLAAALQGLIEMGYGETPIIRADTEAGPIIPTSLELHDTRDEQERGELMSDTGFLLI